MLNSKVQRLIIVNILQKEWIVWSQDVQPKIYLPCLGAVLLENNTCNTVPKRIIGNDSHLITINLNKHLILLTFHIDTYIDLCVNFDKNINDGN